MHRGLALFDVKEMCFLNPQVAPAELESVLLGLEGVADVGVVGVPGEEGEGELPRYCMYCTL
jgi:hypothetical protein